MSPSEMRTRLLEFFPNAQVEVHDLTGGGDHYEVFVGSTLLKGLSRIEQHQKVMSAFDRELKTGEVHALSIRTKTE